MSERTSHPSLGPGEERPLGLFQAWGIELEYMIVDRATLDVRPLSDRVLEAVAGTVVSEVEVGDIAWSNELVLHVVELKTNGPAPSLAPLPAAFDRAVAAVNAILAGHGSRLLPGGMHPWMDPHREMRLWPHDYNPVYEAFDRIFDCRGHGWANLQSMHVNLPFADDGELGRLHAAIRLVLPLLPALAASSPVADGKVMAALDHRLEVYRSNSARVPSVAGQVVPEPVFTRADYERRILGAIYRDLEPFDPAGVLRHEWANARGAIVRFDRQAIEIRLIDVQECPRADLAVAAAVTALVRAQVEERWLPLGRQQAFAVEPLQAILRAAVVDGERAAIADREFLRAFGLERAAASAGEVWRRALDDAGFFAAPDPAGFVASVTAILDHGPLARRILAALGGDASRPRLRAVYGRLADCLERGEMFLP
jgi:gamma-glutamyl:cysteine ligase YbdK (ATP-grasp superfamily)